MFSICTFVVTRVCGVRWWSLIWAVGPYIVRSYNGRVVQHCSSAAVEGTKHNSRVRMTQTLHKSEAM